MHEDDEEADMRTQEELMMQHRYMMVSLKDKPLLLQMRMSHCQTVDAWLGSSVAPRLDCYTCKAQHGRPKFV